MKKLLQAIQILSAIILFPLCAVAQVPVANFGANLTTGCNPIIVHFTDSSTGNPTSWSWDLGNGTLSTVQHPSTTYTAPGAYTVVLTVSNANGSNTKTLTNYINVTPSPIVNFVANDSAAACLSKTVQFTNLSVSNSPGTANYFWDFGDGTTSTTSNPLHTYSIPGIYSVSLVVTNSAGCTNLFMKNQYITVLAKPTASFTASNNNSCSIPLVTSFSNTSTNGSTYAWSFGDGGTSASISPTHTYTAAGSYTVTLVVTSSTGCKDTIIQPAIVNIGSLTAGFTQSATSICSGNAVAFTNTTIPGGGGSTWYFGDGTTSTQISPSHVYATAGTYSVKLVVNFNNCSDSSVHTVTVTNGPNVQFTGTPLNSCSAPFTTTFTNTTTGAASYVWNFGDGTTSTSTSPSHTYTATGNYTVRLIATSSNGCSDTLTRTSYVHITPPSVYISANSFLGCVPAAETFTANVSSIIPIASYSWSFGDGSIGTGSTASHTYTTAGTYTVTVSVTTTTGCTSTATATVLVNAHPTVSFAGTPTNVCPNSPVQFTNSSTGATSYKWLFGDGSTSTSTNPSYSYNTPGVYTVTLIASNGGCTDTLTIPSYITVLNPEANFTTTFSCTNRTQVVFNNTSVGATSYLWNFGDGTTSTLQNPVHTYNSYTQYQVTLTVTSSITGCTNSTSHFVNLFTISPSFSTNDTVACKGSPINLSIGTLTNSATVYVDFGDGSPIVSGANMTSASHVYGSSGIYSVKVRVIDWLGCTDSLTKTNYIRVHAPSVAFTNTPSSGCAPLTVAFTDLSTSTTGYSIASRVWQFGDGSSFNATGTAVTHLYTSAGSYSVKLTVTEGGCSEELLMPNLINVSHPTAQFTSPDTLACANGIVAFNNTSIGNSLSYDWSFGDGTTSTSVSPVHTYTSTGTYSVRLIAIDQTGCRDTLLRNNYINVGTTHSAFTMSDSFAFCPPHTINFTNNSTGGVSYLWNFGNGNTSTLPNPSTIFTTPGTFTVKLYSYSPNGCKDSSTHIVTIQTGPTGTFSYSPTNGCQPLTVTFTSTSFNTTSITYDYNNGITQTTTANTVNFTYTQPGFFIPKLILSNNNGCSTFIIGTDTIKMNKATAGFSATPNPVCVGVPVQFTDSSSAVTTGISSRNWNFGDGGTSTATNPTHSYSASGTYTVRMIAGTPNSCLDTVYHTIVVNPLPVIVGTNHTICSGDSVQLQVSGAATYSWSPATGLSCTNCSNPVAKPSATTTYTITGTSAFGCIGTGTVAVTVNPLPNVNAGTNQFICNGSSVQLNASGASTYVWTPSTGLSCTTCASPVASPSANTTYTVTGTSALGCSSNAQIIVNVGTPPVVTVSPAQTICIGASAQLTASGAATYSWTPTTGLSCASCSNPSASPTSATTYTVIGTSANGCSDTAITTITVNPKPVVSAGSAVAICNGANTTLNASGANTYVWSPATGLSCTTCASPIASPSGTTTYTVTGTSLNGCSDSSTVTVTVNPIPVVSAGTSQSICNGSTAQLQATGASSYVWTPATGLSCTTCSNPVASSTATTTYTVTGTDANGCFATSNVTVTVGSLPTVSGGSNQFICPGGSATLNGSGAATYSWSPATGLSCTTCANPVATPSATTTYTVTGIGSNGCSGSATVTVTVNTNPNISVAGNTAVCSGGNTSLTASGATAYVWSPATGLSCTTCANPSANPTNNTTYTVIGTSGVGCTDSTTVAITVNPLPVVSASPDTAICFGSATTLTALGASTYVWSPATGLSCANCSSPTASPATTTTYTVTGTSSFGCIDTATVTVTVNALPIIAAGNNVAICPGDSTLLTATGGTSYVWTPTTGLSCTLCASPIASPSATTTYTITGTNANGCVNDSTVTVTVNPQPVLSISGNTTVCVGAGTTLTATGAATYVWTPATGLSCTTCASPVASPGATTAYTVAGTSTLGCTGTTTVTVAVNPLPVVSAGANAAICNGSSTTLSASGAASYVWSPATGLNCTACASPVASPTSTTTYTVTGTGLNGCTNTSTVVVTVNPLPVVSAGSNTFICPNDSTVLSATGAASYTWTPATGLSCTTCASPVAAPSSTTTYTVTGTDSNGCINNSLVTVTINAQPVVAIAGNTTICEGSNTALTASGANSFNWSPATGLSCTGCANPTASPATTTTYTVTGTSGVGCSSSTTVTVTVHARPSVAAIGVDSAICPGSSTLLTASGAATYSWSPTNGLSCTACVSPTASPSASTTYVVTGTDIYGCTDTGLVTVSLFTAPNVTATSNASNSCQNTAVQLQASGADAYVWTPATGLNCTTCSNPLATPATTTNYIVTGTDIHGCTDTGMITVGIYMPATVSVSGPSDVCIGSSVALLATGSNTYVWTPSTGLSCTACANPTASPTATTDYVVTGTDIHGCIDTAHFAVTVHALPILNPGAPQSACAGTSVQLQATGATSYLWTPGSGLSCSTCSNPLATPGATTTYMVTGTDAFGCAASDTVMVTIKPLPIINAGPDVSICKATGTQLSATGGVSYVWTPATSLSCATCTSPLASPVVTTTYTVTGTGANGCTNSDAIVVSLYPQPNVNAGPDQTICIGQSAQLQASGAASYVWVPSSTLSCSTCSNPSATPSITTMYSVVGTSINGCKDSDNVVITVIPRTPISVGQGGEICEGESFQLSASGGTDYSWSPAATLSNSTIANPVAHPLQSTDYQVIIRQGQCYADTAHVHVIVHPNPTINAGPDATIVAGDSYPILTVGTNISNYSWSPMEGLSCTTCSNPTATPGKTTTYTVDVSNQWGCKAKDDITITVHCEGNQIWVPNTFTPNGDGENDRFYPHGKGLLQVNRFRVYDRWGELLFDQVNMPVNDKANGWDGTFKGQQLKPDVYVWIINATCTTGEPIETKGDISLVR